MSSHDRDPWWWSAACRGAAPMFDAPSGTRGGSRTRQQLAAEAERIHRAKLICQRCPVQLECLNDALPGRDEGIRAGIVLPAANWKQRKQAAA